MNTKLDKIVDNIPPEKKNALDKKYDALINQDHLKALAETLGEQLGLALKSLDGYEAVYSNNHLVLFDDLNICIEVLKKWVLEHGSKHKRYATHIMGRTTDEVIHKVLLGDEYLGIGNYEFEATSTSLLAAIAEALYKMRND